MKVGIYAGSFDPVTNGHVDIVQRGLNIVDKLVIGVLHNKNKSALLSVKERIDLIKKALEENEIDISRVEIVESNELLVDFAKENKATINIRGVRTTKDYEYEKDMALINKKLYGKLETVFLVADSDKSIISSSMVKEIISFGGDVSEFVPKCVAHILKNIWKKDRLGEWKWVLVELSK